MDRDMLLRHLAQSDQHIAESESHISHQREIVADLIRADRGTIGAEKLLANMLEAHTLQLQHGIVSSKN
jgi:hypothetical protein